MALEPIDAEDFVIEYVGELIRRQVIMFRDLYKNAQNLVIYNYTLVKFELYLYPCDNYHFERFFQVKTNSLPVNLMIFPV